jgi:hypothetical protein
MNTVSGVGSTFGIGLLVLMTLTILLLLLSVTTVGINNGNLEAGLVIKSVTIKPVD